CLGLKLFDAVLAEAAARGSAVVERGEARHPAAAVSALAAEEEAAAGLLPLLHEQALAPSTVAELAASAGVDAGVARKVLSRLAASGAVVRVGPELHFDAAAIAGARARLESFLADKPGGATAAELRDVLRVSRKYAIPLLEYFDAQGVTRREGDLRVLRRA
ncbi:MAG: SelB C-terminal domain-containing protein, partial [Coriobacteriia bacterium]|nr:SelB C-terminal domain-containing protein [Coriobacteriia bacterium]